MAKSRYTQTTPLNQDEVHLCKNKIKSPSYQQEVFSFISSTLGHGNIIPINGELTRFLKGDVNTSMLMSQTIYWTDKTKDPDGWFYKSYREWEQETALTQRKISRSMGVLENMGLIETKVEKVNGVPTLHYRFEHEVFAGLLGRHLAPENVEKELKAPEILVNNETSITKSTQRHVPTLQNVKNRPYIQETTSKKYDDVAKSEPIIKY